MVGWHLDLSCYGHRVSRHVAVIKHLGKNEIIVLLIYLNKVGLACGCNRQGVLAGTRVALLFKSKVSNRCRGVSKGVGDGVDGGGTDHGCDPARIDHY